MLLALAPVLVLVLVLVLVPMINREGCIRMALKG